MQKKHRSLTANEEVAWDGEGSNRRGHDLPVSQTFTNVEKAMSVFMLFVIKVVANHCKT
jgi:hypothetical protein